MHSEVVRHRLTVKLSLPLLRRRRNFTHEVNFTIADNFTCPKGKLSFSVFSVKENTLMHRSVIFTLNIIDDLAIHIKRSKTDQSGVILLCIAYCGIKRIFYRTERLGFNSLSAKHLGIFFGV